VSAQQSIRLFAASLAEVIEAEITWLWDKNGQPIRTIAKVLE
jgi:hypothetical protein